ncbi:hypothetical protein AS156_15625 [Bradyrhizobium macuxiense]|uniref:Uncharacterized protein n=1 Tax=Bradyrhizobium macuxiense TaxID=1755647 RepID=A0A109JJF7_9BRAD|nr:hypothetical protein [Bradyrhizobium macuxiense]KWV49944.1 hypothetical protein AS156_15625 [Bradyrhizobium macuxiense]
MIARNEDNRLLLKLERLKARAASVRADDRAQLIALLDDIGTLRERLMRECARLDGEIDRAMFRATAMTAYGRGARSVRVPRREH